MRTEPGTEKRTSPAATASRPRRRLALLGLGLALRTSLGLSGLAIENQGLSSQAREQIRILQQVKAARTPAQRKLDSRLHHALRQWRFGAVAPGLNALETDVHLEPDGRLLVDLRANVTPGLLEFIERNGGRVVNSFARHNAIRVRAASDSSSAKPARTQRSPTPER